MAVCSSPSRLFTRSSSLNPNPKAILSSKVKASTKVPYDDVEQGSVVSVAKDHTIQCNDFSANQAYRPGNSISTAIRKSTNI